MTSVVGHFVAQDVVVRRYGEFLQFLQGSYRFFDIFCMLEDAGLTHSYTAVLFLRLILCLDIYDNVERERGCVSGFALALDPVYPLHCAVKLARRMLVQS